MREIFPTSTRTQETFRVLGGPRLVGRIHRPSDTDRPGVEFATPKTTLRVSNRSIVKPRMVIETPGGDKYLVADHSRQKDYNTYHLFETDRQVEWKRGQTVQDPVTKRDIAVSPQTMGTIWVMWERARREFMDLNIRVSQDSSLIATGADLQINDTVDGMIVRRVSQALGVTVAELQG